MIKKNFLASLVSKRHSQSLTQEFGSYIVKRSVFDIVYANSFKTSSNIHDC